MGSGQKKRRRNKQLEALEATVHEAISGDDDEEEKTVDRVLATLIEAVLFSDGQGRPLFENPLDEPLFYRQHFLPWVQEGLRIKKGIDEASELNF